MDAKRYRTTIRSTGDVRMLTLDEIRQLHICGVPLGLYHNWVYDPDASNFGKARYRCKCGACGWRPRVLRERDSKAPAGYRLRNENAPIREYPDGKMPKIRRANDPPTREITVRESAGTNATGHYLPPSSVGRR